MRLIFLISIILGFGVSCTTVANKNAVDNSAKEVRYFSVNPGANTQVITYYVQTVKFPSLLQSELEQTMTLLGGKCWLLTELKSQQAVLASGAEYCFRFVRFASVSSLKPYKREPTAKKMLLTALGPEGSLRVENFVWDGSKLQRVRNSDAQLASVSNAQDRFAEFMMRWAVK